jgi:uncharacterized membrane protein
MSDRRLKIAAGALATAGVGIAAYLTYVHYAGIDPQCVVGHGCERVQASRWATLGDIPVAALGLAGYVAILASLAIRREAGRLAGACLALVGAGFSAYLTYLELFEIHAICPWCVASAVLMAGLAALTIARLVRGPQTAPGDHVGSGQPASTRRERAKRDAETLA